MASREPDGKRGSGNARKPSYGDATRMARLLLRLLERPHGWSISSIVDELGISERTLMRYVAACRRDLVDDDERPLLETISRGGRRLLRLTNTARRPESTAYQVLSFYFALSIFQFLDGTVIKDGMEDLWEGFARTLPHAHRERFAHFKNKFYAVPHAVKEYRKFDAQLDVIVQCLVYQNQLRLDYAGLLGDGKTHDFEPYTLLMYRGGLYLLGRSHRGTKMVKLAVERIRHAQRLPKQFEYPQDYSPQKHSAGIFGIIEGPETDVELLIRNAETRAYLEARRIHPTQSFRRRRDGTSVLAMSVCGTEELKYWILGFGPHMEVLRPEQLRREIAAAAQGMAALYANGGG
ncbi:MAG: helix-turn-helix transcriptional regulator [Candidatus Binatia bacterium]